MTFDLNIVELIISLLSKKGLVRSKLVSSDDADSTRQSVPSLVVIDIPKDVLDFHVQLMFEKGLLSSPSDSPTGPYRLTWDGYMLLNRSIALNKIGEFPTRM